MEYRLLTTRLVVGNYKTRLTTPAYVRGNGAKALAQQ